MSFEQVQKETIQNIESIESIESSFKILTREEAIEKIKELYTIDNLPFYLQPKDYFYHNPKSKMNFDIEIQDKTLLDNPILIEFFEIYQINPINILLESISVSKERYNSICAKLNIKLPDEELLRIKIVSQKNFSTSMFGGDAVEIGIIYIEKLIQAILEKNEEIILDTKTQIESQYFHELIHHICDEEFLDNDTIEELTLLGEFLYNPKHNKTRNYELFNAFSEQLFNEQNLKKNKKWSIYHEAYKTVTSKILLKELMERGLITPPITDKVAQSILSNIDEAFSELSDEDRDDILIKYLPMKKDELLKFGISVSEILGISI